jgi:NADPH-dependent F420 reductase
MDIAVFGGTGDIGEGLVLRWALDTDHDVIVGSRDPEKARASVAEYERALAEQGIDAALTGFENGMAAERADVVVLAVPPYHVSDVVETVADRFQDDAILVTPAVGMKSDEEGLHYHRPGAGSVTAVAAESAPDDVPVVGAFHTLAAGKLANLEHTLDLDTLVVGDDEAAKETVTMLAESIDGLRAFDAGPLANAAEVESLTPLLINLARYNADLADVGIRFQ